MILLTAEIRWFGLGGVPDVLAARFSDEVPMVSVEAPREDFYLSPRPAWPGVGIKIRDGKIEAKTRIEAGWDLPLSHGLSGTGEGWSKWSLDPDLGDRADAFQRAFLLSAPIVRIQKHRRQRRYRLEARGTGTAVSEADPAEGGARSCGVELSRLLVRRDGQEALEAWTFGFEAAAPDVNDAFAVLRPCAGHVTAEFGPVVSAVLRAADCESYPAWLANLPGRVTPDNSTGNR